MLDWLKPSWRLQSRNSRCAAPSPSFATRMNPPAYPSLLPPGMQDLSKEDLADRFVEPFTDGREHRAHILDRFHAYLDRVEALGVMIRELWIDGSFTTEKPMPGDIDVAILMDREAMQSIAEGDMEEAQWLFHEAYKPEVKERYRTDAFLLYTDQTAAQDLMKKTWGTYRDDVTKKGIARVVLP